MSTRPGGSTPFRVERRTWGEINIKHKLKSPHHLADSINAMRALDRRGNRVLADSSQDARATTASAVPVRTSRVRLCAPLLLRFNPGYNSNCARASSQQT